MKIIPILLVLILCSCGGGGDGGGQTTQQPQPEQIQTPPPQTPPVLIEASTNTDLSVWIGGLRKIWEPTGPLKGYFILHQGHSSFNGHVGVDSYPEYDLTPMAEALAAAGYRVYGMEMPTMPHNTGPIERFYKPVFDLLDKISGDGYPVYMAGFSGGAWTTTNATALDQRIRKGYSIQGDCPLYLWNPTFTEWDEYSSTIYPYMTLYQMADNRLLHIYGKKDVGPYGFVDSTTAGYHIIYDDTAIIHQVTPWVTQFIINDVNSL